MSRQEGGTLHASTFKFQFRDREDPRFADRRMQSLLRVLHENLHKADASQTSQLLYSVVKLRLPEDYLISALTDQSLELLLEMNPKDLATTVWSLARLQYPASHEQVLLVRFAMKQVLDQIKDEPYLLENESDPKDFSMISSEIEQDFKDEDEQSEDKSSDNDRYFTAPELSEEERLSLKAAVTP